MQLLEWIENYQTQNTRDAARKTHIAWMKYLEHYNINEDNLVKEILEGHEDKRYDELAKFVKTYPIQVQPATIRMYYQFLRAYLRRVHGIKTHIEDSKDFVKQPTIIKINREPMTKDVIKRLILAADDYHKAQFLVLSSSGMRISEFLSLREKDYDFDVSPVKISIKGKMTKTKADRITFVSNEAIKAMSQVDDFFKPRKLLAEEAGFGRIRKRAGLIEKYEDSVNYKIVLHSFRSFFRTTAGEINQDFAEKILGHSGYLSQYIRLTDEKKATYYKQLEPKLRIF